MALAWDLKNLCRPLPQRIGDLVLEIDGRTVPVDLRENARATRLTLRLDPVARQLRLTAPPHVGRKELDAFLERHRQWAAVRLARLPQTLAVAEGALIPFRGEDHLIRRSDKLRGVPTPGIEQDRPVIKVPGRPESVGRKLETFFKAEARAELDSRVSLHAKALGVRARAIRITDTTSRWGSCSTSRTLSFSFRIIMAPPDVLDYLAAHETAHLCEMNHGPRFWALVRERCPQMDGHKAWLRTHGARLHAIRF